MENKADKEIPENQSNVIYADLVFDNLTQTQCLKAFCVFEDIHKRSSVLVSRPIIQESSEKIYANESEYGNHEIESSDSEKDSIDLLNGVMESFSPEPVSCSLEREASKTFLGNVKAKKEFSVKTEKKAKLYCSSLELLEDERILVSTQSGEVFVFDIYGKFLFCQKFDHRFEDTTCLHKCEIAATYSYCIGFFKIDHNDIIQFTERTIDFEYSSEVTVHGICHFNGKLVVICNLPSIFTEHTPFIRLLTVKGKVLNTIICPKFKIPARITCTPDGRNIFVCDQGSKTVICLSQEGEMRWEITQTYTPLDLVLLDKDYLVVSYEKSLVTCFSTRGGIKGEVDTNSSGIDTPYFLTYHKRGSSLFMCAEEMNEDIPKSLPSVQLNMTKKGIRKRFSFKSVFK